jgi:hypothetical protein
MKIVFVHLGTAPAKHLWSNIRSLEIRFPDLEIVLVSDVKPKELISHPKVEFYQYLRSESTQLQLARLDYDFKFRSGFWQYTLERILALDQYHRSVPEKKILHLESDVLLLSNFPFQSFEHLNKMSWLSVDKNRDVATFIYLPDALSTTRLCTELLVQLNYDSTLTDMKFLREYRLKNPNEVLLAPSLSLELATQLIFEGQMDPKLGIELSASAEFFKGFFDPAAIGMWLTGSDPRNYYGFRKSFDTTEIINGGTFINPAVLKYRITSTGEMFVSIDNFESPIWCLHIHSKDLRLFGKSWNNRLNTLIELSNLGKTYSEFDLKCLLNLLRENFRNRTMIGFILHHPKLRWLRSFLLLIRGRLRRSE